MVLNGRDGMKTIYENRCYTMFMMTRTLRNQLLYIESSTHFLQSVLIDTIPKNLLFRRS